MSELKWNWGYLPYLDPPEKQKESALKVGYIKVVDKSEADKVIAHHKFKRCLAMVKYCETRLAYYIASAKRYDIKYVNWKCGHFYRWKYRWMELAEKVKPTNKE